MPVQAISKDNLKRNNRFYFFIFILLNFLYISVDIFKKFKRLKNKTIKYINQIFFNNSN